MKLTLILLCSALLAQDKRFMGSIEFADSIPGCVQAPEQTSSSGLTWTNSCTRTIGKMRLEPKGWVIRIAKGYGFVDLFRLMNSLPSLPYAETLVKEIERRIKMPKHSSVLRIEEME